MVQIAPDSPNASGNVLKKHGNDQEVYWLILKRENTSNERSENASFASKENTIQIYRIRIS